VTFINVKYTIISQSSVQDVLGKSHRPSPFQPEEHKFALYKPNTQNETHLASWCK